ncbi:RRP15-like protein [Lutzomyia longipalpis]|uniref:RRP15-like protein n=1 Tax=Lutzomyia longipalpis TaxID=7200 RepID=UPI0024837949|nr:RRP15-like protein [Lutzomyia longipalpis]
MSALKTEVIVEENLLEENASEPEDDNQLGDEGDVSASNSSDDDGTDKKSGWADSIARVLAEEKPKNKTTLIFSRATKPKGTEKKKLPFEIDGEIKEVEKKPTKEELDNEAAQQKAERLERKRKRDTLRNLNVKPDATERSRELALKRVATRGVVQLFNAVQAQQKDITKRLDSEKLEHKREKVLKSVNKTAFLDALMGGPRAKSERIDNPVKKEEVKDEEDSEDEDRPSTWNVLKDDFMMLSKKNKDWDKMDEEEEDDRRSEPEESEDSNEESD